MREAWAQWRPRWVMSQKAEDLDTTEMDISPETLEKLLRVDAEVWKNEIEGIEEFYSKFDTLPKEITDCLETLKEQIL